MPSLAECIRRAGKALSERDRLAIEDMVGDGMAPQAAVRSHLSALEAQVADLVAQAPDPFDRYREAQEARPIVGFVDEPIRNKDGEYRRNAKGDITGAPEGVATEEDVARIVDRMVAAMEDPLAQMPDSAEWYEVSGQAIREIAGNNPQRAEELVRMMATLSATNRVGGNATGTIKAIYQLSRGETPAAGRFPNVFAKHSEEILAAEDISQEVPGVDDKIMSFYRNLWDATFDSSKYEHAVTMDMWMARLFGYQTDSFGNAQYRFAAMMTQRIADAYNKKHGTNLLPRQVQAALWVYARNRERFGDAIGADIKTEDRAAFDTYIERAKQNITLEAIPSVDSGLMPEIHTMSWEQRQEYTRQAIQLILNEQGENDLFKRVGIPLYGLQESEGSFEGAVSPNVILPVVAEKNKGKYDTTKADLAAMALQYIYTQDGVPWVQFDSTLTGTTPGVAVRLSGAPTLKMEEAFLEHLNGIVEGADFTRVGDDLVMLNYTGMSNRKFLAQVREAAETYDGPGVDSIVEIVSNVKAAGNYLAQDWTDEAAAVAELEGKISDAGGSDLLPWLRRRREAVARLQADFGTQRFYQQGLTDGDQRRAFEANRRANEGRLEGAVDADGNVELVHWSKEPLTETDPSRWATGLSRRVRSERNRQLSGAPPRTYFGIEANDNPYQRERALGTVRNVGRVPIEMLYNPMVDPDNLWTSRDLAENEQAIQDAGYAGYWVDHKSLGKIAAIFDSLPVTTEQQGVTERQVDGPDQLELFTDGPPTKQQLQDVFAVIVESRPTRELRATTNKINIPQDLIDVISDIGYDAQETFLAIVTDKDDNILRVIRHTKGLRDSSAVDPLTVAAEVVSIPDAHTVHFGHNHPSGVARPSKADIIITAKLEQVLSAVGVKAGDHAIVTPSGRATLVEDIDIFAEFKVSEDKPRNVFIPMTERFITQAGVLQNAVNSQDQANARLNALEAAENAVLLLNVQHFPVGVVYLTNEESIALRKDNFSTAKRILSAFNTTNAYAALVKSKHSEFAANLIKMLSSARVRVLDAQVDGEMDQSLVTDYGSFEIKRFTQQRQERGFIELRATGERIIHLLEQTNRSTFLHEAAHLFLEMEKQFAAEFGVTENQQRVLDWLEVDSFDAITTDHHEKYAETFEKYLEEGKAPSAGLRQAFAKFRSWLTAIYRNLDPRTRADLTPEITEYFDRLLATEDEINRMADNEAYDELFRSPEQAGMTDAEWVKYQEQRDKARNRATSTLDEKLIKELKRRKQREWREEKAPLIDEERERLAKQPVYQVLSDLDVEPINYDDVVKLNGGKVPGKMIGKATKEGLSAAEYAEIHGFDNAQQMIDEINAAPTLKAASEAAAEQLMVLRHGDVLNDGSIEQEAREAMANEEQANLLLMELRALDRTTPEPDRERLKVEAERIVSRMRYKEIRPDKYFRAMQKYGAQAAAATNPREAAQAKRQQLANQYLYKEALKQRQNMERWRKYVKGVQKRTYDAKAVDPTVSGNMQLLARSYDMAQTPQQAGQVQGLVSWFRTQILDTNEFADVALLDARLIEMMAREDQGLPVDYTLPHWKDLTVEEMRSLYDQLRQMRWAGGMRAEEKRMTLMAEREEWAASIRKHATKSYSREHERSLRTKVRNSDPYRFIFSHRRFAGQMGALDGWDDGPMQEHSELLTFQTGNHEIEMKLDMAKRMDDALKPAIKALNRRGKVTITKEDGTKWSLSPQARFLLGLHMGNAGNRETLLRGLNENYPDMYTEGDLLAFLATMSDEELQALNDTWAALETLWEPLSGTYVRMKGVAPVKLPSLPFEVNGIKLTGGHFKLTYKRDPKDTGRHGFDAEGRPVQQKLDVTPAGSTQERVGSGGREVDIENFQQIYTNIEENIHYIAYAEAARRLKGVFQGVSNPVPEAIIRTQGQAWYDNVVSTIEATVSPDVDRSNAFWRMAQKIRTNLTYAYLVLSVRNFMQQPIAFTNGVAEIGERWASQGVYEFYRDMATTSNAMQKIKERSPFMRNRMALINREAREQLASINSIHPVVGAAKKLAFAPQTAGDGLAAYPLWVGAAAKMKSENPDATEEQIVKYADDVVRKSVGSGLPQDLGSIFNADEAMKQVTFMGTFFNLTFNMHVDNYQKWKGGQISGLEYARRLAWMAVVPGILSAWIVDDWPEDAEADEIAAHILWKITQYNFAAVFGLRELASALDGFSPGIPGLKLFVSLARLMKTGYELTTGEREFDVDTSTRIMRDLQPIIPIPTQIPRMIEGMQDPSQNLWEVMVEGEERD